MPNHLIELIRDVKYLFCKRRCQLGTSRCPKRRQKTSHACRYCGNRSANTWSGSELGLAHANPLASLKIRKEKAPKKPEITDAEIVEIREALRDEPEWKQVPFEIGLNTGCRLRETRIPLSRIDFAENKITFRSPKGGEERAFSILMPTAFKDLLRRLASQRRKHTLEFPFQLSRRWQQFFIKIN